MGLENRLEQQWGPKGRNSLEGAGLSDWHVVIPYAGPLPPAPIHQHEAPNAHG